MNAPTARRPADRRDLDLAVAADLDALADEIRRRGNPAGCDARPRPAPASSGDFHIPVGRNEWGFPVAPERDLYADWGAADREGLASIQRAVIVALDDWHEGEDIAWIVEETLWQMRAALVRGYRVRIPLVGDLAVRADGTLIASAVAGLSREDGGEGAA